MTDDEAIEAAEAVLVRARGGEDVSAALSALPPALRDQTSEAVAAERELWAAFSAEPPPAARPAPSAVPFASGAPERIGPFTVKGELARGGMGVVFAAVDRDGWPAAIKVCSAKRAGHTERFLREARAVGRLRHPNVVRVIDVGVEARGPDEGFLWFAMERVDGASLDRVVRAEGPLAPREVARVGIDLARALTHAHLAGVLHRDVKPGNVMLRRADRTPVLVDFGLARLADDEDPLTSTGDVVGTPSHMSPEQGAGRRADARTDVWGLGATLYDALTGRPPIAGTTLKAVLLALHQGKVEPPRSVRPDVPEALERIILEMLRHDPAKRPGLTKVVEELSAL